MSHGTGAEERLDHALDDLAYAQNGWHAALDRIASLEEALNVWAVWRPTPGRDEGPETFGNRVRNTIVAGLRSALGASAVPTYTGEGTLAANADGTVNLEASAVPEPWTERHSRWHSGGDCGCSWAETLNLPASAVPEPTDHNPGCPFWPDKAGDGRCGCDIVRDSALTLAATPPGPHSDRQGQIERIATALNETEKGGGWQGLAERLYEAGLRATPSREAEGREHDE